MRGMKQREGMDKETRPHAPPPSVAAWRGALTTSLWMSIDTRPCPCASRPSIGMSSVRPCNPVVPAMSTR